MIISALILFVATLIFGDNLTLDVIAFIVGTVLFPKGRMIDTEVSEC